MAAVARGRLLPATGAARRPLAVGALVLLVVVALGTAWTSLRPLRADLAAADARRLPGPFSARAFDDVVATAPWEAEYRLLQATALSSAKRPDEARAAVRAAAEMRGGSAQLALTYADLALKAGDAEESRRWAEIALKRDPNNPVALDRAAELAREDGDVPTAKQREARAAELRARYGGS